MLAAILCFTLMDAAAKDLIARTPAPLVIWARFAGMLAIVLILFNRRIPSLLHTRFPVLHFWRSAFQFGATSLFFLSLAHIGLAEATALTDINPVLITLGAALFLGESLGPRRIAGVLVAMCGALIVIRPGMGVFTPAAFLPLGAAICYTGNALLTRRIGPYEPAATALLYAAAFGTIAGALALPFVWQPIPPTDIAHLALIAALGTAAQFCIIRSFSITEAAIVAPFAYAGIIMATLWGILFFNEYPDRWTILGALVIAGAGLYVWHRETMAKPQ